MCAEDENHSISLTIQSPHHTLEKYHHESTKKKKKKLFAEEDYPVCTVPTHVLTTRVDAFKEDDVQMYVSTGKRGRMSPPGETVGGVGEKETAGGRKKINCSIGKTGHVLATRLEGRPGEIASASLLLSPPMPSSLAQPSLRGVLLYAHTHHTCM